MPILNLSIGGFPLTNRKSAPTTSGSLSQIFSSIAAAGSGTVLSNGSLSSVFNSLALSADGVNGVSRDGPQSVMRPLSLAEWQNVGGGILVPDYYWLMQETTGGITDEVQGLVLSASASPIYGVPISGWTSRCVGTLDKSNGAGFSTNTLGWETYTQSVVALLYSVVAAATTARVYFPMASFNQEIVLQSNGRMLINPGNTSGSVNYFDAVIHPFMVESIGGAGMTAHSGAGLWRFSSDKEQFTASWSQQTGVPRGLGPGTIGAAAGSASYNILAVWVGSKAEAMSSIGPKTILQRLNWTVTGY